MQTKEYLNSKKDLPSFNNPKPVAGWLNRSNLFCAFRWRRVYSVRDNFRTVAYLFMHAVSSRIFTIEVRVWVRVSFCD